MSVTKSKEQKEKAPAIPPDGGEDTDQVKKASGGTSGKAAQNMRNNPDNEQSFKKDGDLTKDAKLNDDPMGRSAAEETADRQADSLADATTTFTRSFLVPGDSFDEKSYDHGPNMQSLVQDAINNGLRILGLPEDAMSSTAQEGYDDLEPHEAHNIGLVEPDQVVKFVGAEEVDFGVPGHPHVNQQLTYAAECVPAHLIGAGATEALTDQVGNMRQVVSPRHFGSTGAGRLHEPGDDPDKKLKENIKKSKGGVSEPAKEAKS
jgi:hypothetical protein